jgi:hypothetical protein
MVTGRDRADARWDHPLDTRNPRVIFILGWGRSGSTLIGNALGELHGCVSVGELHDIWSAYQGRFDCGCALPLPECPFWSQVVSSDPELAHAFASAADVHRIKRRYLRVRYVPWLLRGSPPGRGARAALEGYADTVLRLYRSLAETRPAEVVIDSMKTPAAAAFLLRLPLHVSYIHLVRDPRATGFSWQRRRAADLKGTRQQNRLGYGHNAISWLIWNTTAELVRRQVDREHWARVRYEDFVAAPDRVLREVAERFHLPTADWPLEDHLVRLGTHHTVEGNPSRFKTGTIAVSSDDEWEHAVPRWASTISVALTAPLFYAYGYRWRRP